MILPDVNVLIYAFREDSEHHAESRRWLDGVINGENAYGMSPQVLSSLIRIVTHPTIFKRTSRLAQVTEFANILLDQPHCQIIQPGERHWGIFTKLCGSAKATGNLVPDAWFAALAIESGCEWISTDGDYKRFAGLRVRSPFD